jgi:hypothetical protein
VAITEPGMRGLCSDGVTSSLPCWQERERQGRSLVPDFRPVDERDGLAVSVIVPATRAAPTLARCLAAIDAARAADDEVIVVTDGVPEGPAGARNRGAAEASNEILVFVDADVEVRADAFALVRERFAADPGLTAVFGSYDDDPEARDVVSMFRNLLHHHVHHGAAGSVGSFWTGLGAVRRAAFEEVGGFDMRRVSVEDIELGARLCGAGRIELDPSIQGKHLKRWTLLSMVRTDLTHRGIPWTRLALRGRATRSELNLSWRHKLSAASSLAILLSVTRRRPATAAVSLGILCTLNQGFYRLLARRGKRYVFSGVGLHVVHHLTAILSLLVGFLDLVLVVVGRGGRRPTNGYEGVEVLAQVHANGEPVPGPSAGLQFTDSVDIAAQQTGAPAVSVAALMGIGFSTTAVDHCSADAASSRERACR